MLLLEIFHPLGHPSIGVHYSLPCIYYNTNVKYIVDILFRAAEMDSCLASSPSYALAKLSHIFLPSNDDL